MKKVIMIICLLILVSGCTQIKNMKLDSIVNKIATRAAKANTYRTGYKYYLPRNMQVVDSKLYNEVIEDSRYEYYLYVDVVSYFDNVKKDYVVNKKAVYSTSLMYDGKYGYLEINNLENDKYLVEIMYNYAKIEVIVDKDSCNEVVLSAINILKSIEYNDSIIANLLGDDVLSFSEEEIDIFNIKGKDVDVIIRDDGYETEDDKNQIPDLDLIN